MTADRSASGSPYRARANVQARTDVAGRLTIDLAKLWTPKSAAKQSSWRLASSWQAGRTARKSGKEAVDVRALPALLGEGPWPQLRPIDSLRCGHSISAAKDV